ncbi:MAG: glycoside hydrolase family 30 beta sandwich domain-containing protein [Chitinophagaceae bacterium]
MKRSIIFCLLLALTGCSKSNNDDTTTTDSSDTSTTTSTDSVSYWLTDPTNSVMFLKRTRAQLTASSTASTITIDTTTTYQTVDGFGFTLTDGSAEHLAAMSSSARTSLLTELFDSTSGIGISYLRLTMGASDLSDTPYSYDDLSSGISTDTALAYFSIEKAETTLIPILKEILAINPNIKLMASPWSAPSWMKSNSSTVSGSLNTDYYDVYARYFVKYIQAMETDGITIDAVTVQNEPLNATNNPSMYMTADEQLAFVKNSLGPIFASNGITTKIIIYDHNADMTSYASTILADADAAQYVDGSAFHLYAGDISNLGTLHDSYPAKNLYFTEQYVSSPDALASNLSWHIQNVIIGSMRNWCKTALEWNLSSNATLTPYTTGGCSACLGGVTISGDNVTRNSGYYIIAHASKLVRPGSVRVATNTATNLPNVAFQTPDGTIILIVYNTGSATITFNIAVHSKTFSTTINAGSVETIIL